MTTVTMLNTAGQDHAAWLANRRTGIGGSDIAAIMGLSPWRSPLDVYLDKTGAAEPVADSESMYWGRRLEDVVASEWQQRAGRRVQRVNTMLRRTGDEDWMLANIDRAIVAPGSRVRVGSDGASLIGAAGVLEVKTASAHAAADWQGADGSDALPVYYAAQGMWYLAVTGQDVCEFAALIGGQRFVTRRVERDEETIRGMVEQAREFWRRHVMQRMPPEPRTGAEAAKLWRRDQGDMRAIDDSTPLLTALNELRSLRSQAKELDAQIDGLTDELKLAIGPASGLTVGGQPVVTWRASKDRTETDWQAVAHELAAMVGQDALAPIVARHTTTKPGSRRFIVKD
jgi:putative phage-type endonuclease